MLESIPATRTIFEPFHGKKGYPQLAPYRYRYLPPEEDNSELENVVEDILTGALRSSWSDQFNPLYPFTFRRRLIKEVRVNLLSPWMIRRWPDARFLFLVRHPIPVALSQLRGGWKLSSKRLYEQKQLVDRYGLDELSQFEWPTDGFESLVLFWAIENRVALRAAHDAGALVVRYEDLVLRPENALEEIQNYIGTEFPGAVWKRFGKSSWSSRRSVGNMAAADKVNRWRRETSNSQIDFVHRVLDICELDSLYGSGPQES